MSDAAQALLDELRRNNNITEDDIRTNQAVIDAMFYGGQVPRRQVSTDTFRNELVDVDAIREGRADLDALRDLELYDYGGDVAFRGADIIPAVQRIEESLRAANAPPSPDLLNGPGHLSLDDNEMARERFGLLDMLELRPAQQRNLFRGQESTPGIGPEVHQRQADAYLDYANPELDRRYDAAGDELVYGLSRAGQLQSSTGAERYTDLERRYADQRDQIAGRAEQRKQASKRQLADEHARLSELAERGVSGPNLAREYGQATQGLEQVQDFDPLGQVFADVLTGIGQGVQGFRDGRVRQRTRNAYASDPSNSGSGRVVR